LCALDLETLLFEMMDKTVDKRVQSASEVRRRLMAIYRQMVAPG
jgi:hypothetical protein